MTATLVAERVAVLRCNQVACPGTFRFTYYTDAEKRAALDANCDRPWRCARHDGQGHLEVVADVDVATYGGQQLGMVA